ncbi:hypothetical protein ACGFNU_01375 [Spirillospora sp. NPDC048911]|uniref:hypothetical protein n=1 Tax=Spirillospora sp. NPDC048911 TaxID=3364527 RepID=UPI0037244ADC
MSMSNHGTWVGSGHVAVDRELWALLVRGLDGDLEAREAGRHELLKAAPVAWDKELERAGPGGVRWMPLEAARALVFGAFEDAMRARGLSNEVGAAVSAEAARRLEARGEQISHEGPHAITAGCPVRCLVWVLDARAARAVCQGASKVSDWCTVGEVAKLAVSGELTDFRNVGRLTVAHVRGRLGLLGLLSEDTEHGAPSAGGGGSDE